MQISTTYFNQLWSNSHSQILPGYINLCSLYWVLKLSIFSLPAINSSSSYDIFNSHNQILSCSLYQQMRWLIGFILCFNTTWGYMTMSQFQFLSNFEVIFFPSVFLLKIALARLWFLFLLYCSHSSLNHSIIKASTQYIYCTKFKVLLLKLSAFT